MTSGKTIRFKSKTITELKRRNENNIIYILKNVKSKKVNFELKNK